MPRISKKDLESGFFHIMSQGINKEKIFESNKNKKRYQDLMQRYQREQKIRILAYCIMDNHVHMLIFSDEMQEISTFMKKLNTNYAIYYNKIEERVGYVFRNRYKSEKIYNQSYLKNCLKYIHMNPVKAGIVKKEKDYKYSSYCDYINKEGIVNDETIRMIFNSEYNYLKEFLEIEYEENLFFNSKEKEIKEYIAIYCDYKDVTIEELVKKQKLLKNLYNNLKEQYEISKSKMAQMININRTKLVRLLKK